MTITKPSITGEEEKKPLVNPPRAYDLSDKSECRRLLLEVRWYLHTCRREHHGTDWEGRAFAIEALDRWLGDSDQ